MAQELSFKICPALRDWRNNTQVVRSSLRTPVKVVDRFIPTTRTCSECGHRQDIGLSERMYRCKRCGVEIDRDMNAAINMLRYVGLDRSEVTPVELETARRLFRGLPYVRFSSVEAGIPHFKAGRRSIFFQHNIH